MCAPGLREKLGKTVPSETIVVCVCGGGGGVGMWVGEEGGGGGGRKGGRGDRVGEVRGEMRD